MKTSRQLLVTLTLAGLLTACGQDETAKSAPVAEVAKPAPAAVEAPKPVEPSVPAQPPAPPVAENIVKAEATGEKIYATCVGCHGSVGEGGVGPKLQGQSVAELAQKLQLYKAGKEIGPMSAMMIPNAMQLSDQDITLVAEYMATLK